MMIFKEGLIFASVMFTVFLKTIVGSTSTTKAKDACVVCFCQSENKREVVYCNDHELSTVPSGIPANVSKLYLNRNILKFIGEDVFLPLTNLRELYLDYNLLTFIGKDVFLQLTNLRVLDLSINQLTSVSKLAFQNPNILEQLYLKGNLLTFIGDDDFLPLTNLRVLYLSGNLLKFIGRDVFLPLTKLQVLYLNDNLLAFIGEDVFLPLTNLRVLSLEYNNLSAFSTHFVSGMIKLQNLSLSKNQIRHLSADTFLSMRQLILLDLSENGMEIISTNSLQSLLNLRSLDLSGNTIEELPEESFHNFYNIETIRLSRNTIGDIPDLLLASMGNLLELVQGSNEVNSGQVVKISEMEENHIPEIREPHFSNLRKLKRLFIRWNKIHNIEKDSFVNLIFLEEVYLSENNLESLPEYVFFSTNFLQVLDLTNNSLATLPTHLLARPSQVREIHVYNNVLNVILKDSLSKLALIQNINLAENMIKDLNEDSFTYLPCLTTLFLSKNEISRLPNPIFRDLRNLQYLYIDGNDLRVLSSEIFSHLENLLSLTLHNNKLYKIDPGVFSTLKLLILINLESNKLTELPEKLLPGEADFSRLDLSFNKLERLPKTGVGNVRQIAIFTCSGNSIELIEKENFGRILEISYFFMSKNKISSLPRDLFSSVVIRKTLDFSYNHIKTLPLKLFQSNNRTHELDVLFLHRNQLTYLPQGIFYDLPNLRSLSLFYNNLQTLADNTFEGLSGGKIYLFENNLTFLDHSYFNNENISELHLYGNDITWIRKMSLNGISKTTKVFIDCENVQGLQDPNFKLICVTPTFVPIIQVDHQVSVEMGREGFKCEQGVDPWETFCSPCTRGTFGNRKNKCIPCPPGGFYEDEIGRTIQHDMQTCKRCRNGTYVSNGGGKSISDCTVCPDGTNKQVHAGHRACFCLDGYARVDRFGPCYVCYEEGIDCMGRDYKSLQHGFYWSWDFSNANLTNYKKFLENIKNTNGTFDSNTKYNGTIPRAFLCPRRKSCNNTGGSVEVSCAVGYKGWLCSKCEEKFYSVLNYCLICPKTELLYLQTALTLCLLVIGCACLFRFYTRKQSRGGNGRSVMDILISQGKIMLGFYQMIGELFTTLHDVNWTRPLNYIGDIISIIELNIFQLFVRPQCFHEKLQINPKVEFVLAITYLALTVVVPFVIYHILKVIHSKSKHRSTIDHNNTYVPRVKSNIVTFIIVTLFLTYPPVCTIIFQIYPAACEKFCLDVNNNTCKVLLRSDYEIACRGLDIYHIFAYIATAGYIMAYPVVLFYLLRKRVKGLLFQRGHDTFKPTSKNHDDDVMNIKSKSSCDDGPNDVWIDFLCESYKPQYWYWEILELTRKVAQTALITLLGWKNRLTVLATIGVSVLFLTLHARFMPMKRVSEQRLQMFSLVAILVNVVVAATDIPDDYGDALAVALVIINIGIVVIILGEVVLALLIRIRPRKLVRMFFWFHTKYISSFMGTLCERFRQTTN